MTVQTERRLAAIMVADIVGYSRLIEADEADTLAAIRDLRVNVIDPLLADRHGRIVKLMGDGALVEFSSVVDAVACAVAVQRGVAERQTAIPPERRIVFRIGINLGDVVVEDDGDLLGDGINVAARLEQLCEPGGVMVSGTAYDHLQGRLGLPLEDAGEQRVKNISRPVRAYRVRLDGVNRRWRFDPWRLRHRLLAAIAAAMMVPAIVISTWWWFKPNGPISDQPSVAILPFVNMSGDPAQDYFGPGVAEEIITVLSTFPAIRVVSRTSSFVYDKPAKIQSVANDLGVRYVLEGSVRKSADRVRVTAQLINAISGDHVWASRYDQEGTDLVALQENIANRIYDSVAGLTGMVRKEEELHAWRKSAPDLTEYDYYLRGHQIYMTGNTLEINSAAREVWQEGLAHFPNSGLMRNKLAWTYLRDVAIGRSNDPAHDVERAWKLGREAEAIEDKPRLLAWLVHWQMAWLYQWHDRDFERSVVEAEATIRMVPYDSFSHADLSEYLARAGRLDEAIAWGEEAIGREIHAPDWYHWNLGWAYYLAGRPKDSLAEVDKMSDKSWSQMLEAVAYVRLGRVEEARAKVADYLKTNPTWSLKDEAFYPLKEPLKQSYLDDLRKAGMPE